MPRDHAQYLRRRAAGVCVKCGKKPPVETLTVCPECLQAGREYRRSYAGSLPWRKGGKGRPPTGPVDAFVPKQGSPATAETSFCVCAIHLSKLTETETDRLCPEGHKCYEWLVVDAKTGKVLHKASAAV